MPDMSSSLLKKYHKKGEYMGNYSKKWSFGLSLTLAVALLTLLASCGEKVVYEQPELGYRSVEILEEKDYQFKDLNKNGELDVYEDWRKTTDERVADLLSKMSIEQRVGLLVTATSPGMEDDGSITPEVFNFLTRAKTPIDDWIYTKHIRLSNNRESAKPPSVKATWANNIQEMCEESELGNPYWFSGNTIFNGIKGTRAGHTAFPQGPGVAAAVLGMDGDTSLIEEWGKIASVEYRAIGMHMPLWPQLDLATEPRWGRVHEIFGEDSDTAISIVIALMKGIFMDPVTGEQIGISPKTINPVVKHWPGSGTVDDGWDSHFEHGRFSVYDGDYFDYQLRVFQAAFDAGVMSVMPCYSIYKTGDWSWGDVLDGNTLEQVATGYNKTLLTDVLRGAQGFDGLTYSDTGILYDAPSQGTGSFIGMPWGVEDLDIYERISKSVNAGMDIHAYDNVENIIETYNKGMITEEQINTSAGRVLAMQMELGLFENPYVDADAADSLCNTKDSSAVGFEVQKQSIVLLQNKDNTLPRNARIAYTDQVGDRTFAPDLDTKIINPYVYEKTPLDSVNGADLIVLKLDAPKVKDPNSSFFGYADPNVEYVDVDWRESVDGNNDGDYDDMVDTDGDGTGDTLESELEGKDRDNIEELWKFQETLANKPANAKLVVIVNLDRPSVLTQLLEADALLANFDVSDKALASVIWGEYAPTGKLPFELPSSQEAVDNQLSDVPHDSVDPLFEYKFGLTFHVE